MGFNYPLPVKFKSKFGQKRSSTWFTFTKLSIDRRFPSFPTVTNFADLKKKNCSLLDHFGMIEDKLGKSAGFLFLCRELHISLTKDNLSSQHKNT